MPTKEIKELRQAGRLDEAYSMAKAELEADPNNIWSLRNMSWVIYSQLNSAIEDLPVFLTKIAELTALNLPANEEMLFDNLSIVISKAARHIAKEEIVKHTQIYQLFDAIKELPIKRDSQWFRVLYKAFHKGFKESPHYIEFADWWNFENFAPEDYEKEKLPEGREIMAIVEQAYIAYVKHLLPKNDMGHVVFEREAAEHFLPKITALAENHPSMQYPSYFQAKLLLALGDKENMLSALLPFAKKKQGEFWVWDIFSEAFSSDIDKVFACYCKALSCGGKEELLVGLRQRMAELLVSKKMYNEAKVEIEHLVKARDNHDWKLPNIVVKWQTEEWYKNAVSQKTNNVLYNRHKDEAETLLYSDIPQELVFIEFVNKEKMIANFIVSETKYGFFKYDRFLKSVNVGDVLNVRFQGGEVGGRYNVYTVQKVEDEQFKSRHLKNIDGVLRIKSGQSFGFMDDIFVHPSVISKNNLEDGSSYRGIAIKSFNKEKKLWGWKLL